MALALSKFEALCGFLPEQEMVAVLEQVPELGDLIGVEAVQQYLAAVEAGQEEACRKVKGAGSGGACGGGAWGGGGGRAAAGLGSGGAHKLYSCGGGTQIV